MKSIISIFAICTLVLSQAHAGMLCETQATKAAAKSQSMTDGQFKQAFKVKVRHAEVEEMVVNEAYLFQNKIDKNIEVSVMAQAVKVMGKINCSAKVTK
jgi:hypothetical protein